jgi:hypothetical protein
VVTHQTFDGFKLKTANLCALVELERVKQPITSCYRIFILFFFDRTKWYFFI